MDIFAPRFQNETAAREHLEAIRWPEGPFCPHCGSFNAKRMPAIERKASKGHNASKRDGVVQCRDCRKQYTVTVGTVFERSKVPLHKWLLVNHLLVCSKKGISAHQVHRMIGVTYKTAWFMCHRIREAMDNANSGGKLGGPGQIVEADEAWVGGLAKNRAYGQPAPKKIMMTLVERGGRARSFHVANITGPLLRTVVIKNVDRASTLATDERSGYRPLKADYIAHMTVNHFKGQYKKGDQAHSNTAENFFSIFKRGVIGTYHHISEAHLHRYAREFDLRYSTRNVSDTERADISLAAIYGRRLTYRRTGNVAA